MINLTFKLSGQIPSGKNAVKITRTGMRYPDKRFKAWRDEALKQVSTTFFSNGCPSVLSCAYDKPVTMIVDYVPADARRRDLPGMCDALCHLLEKAGILADDCLVHKLNWQTFSPDKARAGVTVTVIG